MHRNASLDDVFDVMVELVERLDPPPNTMITSTQLIVGAELSRQQADLGD